MVPSSSSMSTGRHTANSVAATPRRACRLGWWNTAVGSLQGLLVRRALGGRWVLVRLRRGVEPFDHAIEVGRDLLPKVIASQLDTSGRLARSKGLRCVLEPEHRPGEAV